MQKYVVKLSNQKRKLLEELIDSDRGAAKCIPGTDFIKGNPGQGRAGQARKSVRLLR